MKKEEKLYEVLGELLYAIAISDGVIQIEEREALQSLLRGHAHKDVIKWSFDYEESKKSTLEEMYNKVLNFCHGYGASPVYSEFIDAMKTIAEASEGIDDDESKIINSFSSDLIERFKRDANALIKMEREERD